LYRITFRRLVLELGSSQGNSHGHRACQDYLYAPLTGTLPDAFACLLGRTGR